MSEDVVVLGDLTHPLVVLVEDLLPLEGGQAAQLHLQDRVGLQSSMSSKLHQRGAGVVDRRAGPDQRDDLVECVQRLEVAAQDVGALLGLAQPVAACGAG